MASDNTFKRFALQYGRSFNFLLNDFITALSELLAELSESPHQVRDFTAFCFNLMNFVSFFRGNILGLH